MFFTLPHITASAIMTSQIPTITQCLQHMEDFAMYHNIRAHSLLVARVAELLINGLENSHKNYATLPDKDLVIAGALLHDIAKTKCLQEGCLHAEVGERLCTQLGYPEIAEIVRQHVVLEIYTEDAYKRGLFGAVELVYYADKRVKHDQVVSLQTRLEYILDKYGKSDPTREYGIRRNFQQCQQFEEYLFSCLDFAPEDIDNLLLHASSVLPLPADGGATTN